MTFPKMMSFREKTPRSPKSPLRRRRSSWTSSWLNNSTTSFKQVVSAVMQSQSPRSISKPQTPTDFEFSSNTDRTLSLPDSLLLKILHKLPESQNDDVSLVCKRWLNLQGRRIGTLRVLDLDFLLSGKLLSRFPKLTNVDLSNACIYPSRNSAILLSQKSISFRVSSNWDFVEENLLHSETVDRGLRVLGRGSCDLLRLVVINATEMGLLGLAEQCCDLQELELHKCNDNLLRGIAACENLRALRLVGSVDGLYTSSVSDIGLTILAQGCKRLVKLELSGCEGSFDGIRAIGQCCEFLEDFTVSHHRMDDGWIAALALTTPAEMNLRFAAVVCCLWLCSVVCVAQSGSSSTDDAIWSLESKLMATSNASQLLMVPLTLIQGAASKGAVCLDGTLPGYHLHRGLGSGANRWLIQLEGGGWCNTRRSCIFRKTTRRGSSNHMEKVLAFTGILSNKANENPDFFNWNRVKLRYCDGASFTGDSEDQSSQLYYRGQRIWQVAMEELLSKGMQKADQALLSGCSAGGLASILHCDQFKAVLPGTTKVKCLSDAGMFMDAVDVSGGHSLRNMFQGVVTVQNLQKELSTTCTKHLDPTSCFFPQNLVSEIKTPMFLLNAAYDAWQVQESLAPPSADRTGSWKACKSDHSHCNSSQIHFFQDFRSQMVNAVKTFSASAHNGLFINSCFAHCQSERQDTWFAPDSPRLYGKTVAESVGDWYFDRKTVKAIDCPYPCDKTCHDLTF